MENYRLIAVDMDGTLLDSQKNISKENIRAIRDAVAAGKAVAIDSGRCIAELMPTLRMLPEIRYASAMCGAYIWDAGESRLLYSRELPEELILRIFDATREFDPMYQLMSDQAVIERSKYDTLGQYQMEIFRGLFDETARIVEDLPAYYTQEKIPVYVFNMYLHSAAEREAAKEKLLPLGVTVMFDEKLGLACSLSDCNKGTGLKKLCELTGIPIEQAVAVGDADNDRPMIRVAGLGVAMGNASEDIKAEAGFVAPDNDRDGVAAVIDRFLLNR